MEKCIKCNGDNITVSYQAVGESKAFYRAIDGVTKFMRNDTYYYSDTVKKEHLIYKCETCGYRAAKECKDS